MILALAMLLTSPMPFPAAVRRLESKTPVATNLTTAQIAQIDLALRDRAFFSVRVDELRIASAMYSRIGDALNLVRRDGGAFMDRSRFIADMRADLGAVGDTGKLTDITSAARLGLVYDFNTEDAIEYGRWLARQDPDILDAYPCDELARVEERRVPRGFRRGPGGGLIEVPEEGWPARWEAAGGQFYDGRMIARKDSLIWEAISRFGRPWPPFDFMSGMGRVDVTRDEAIALGVIAREDPPPQPQKLDFNHNLQASVPEAPPELIAAFQGIFGETATMTPDGKIVWVGRRGQAVTDDGAPLGVPEEGGEP